MKPVACNEAIFSIVATHTRTERAGWFFDIHQGGTQTYRVMFRGERGDARADGILRFR